MTDERQHLCSLCRIERSGRSSSEGKQQWDDDDDDDDDNSASSIPSDWLWSRGGVRGRVLHWTVRTRGVAWVHHRLGEEHGAHSCNPRG